MCEILSHVEIPIQRNGETIKSTFFSFAGNDEISRKEHFAIGLGDFKNNPRPLVRVHSECMTGDVFYSRRCDCGEQLTEAIDLISKEGGYILYLRQEGRGIGLFKKFEAYRLQDVGFNTYEANKKLGFQDDQRMFDVAAAMLKALGATDINLLSNNNRKRVQLEKESIKVHSMRCTQVYMNEHNKNYLTSKKEVGKHNFVI